MGKHFQVLEVHRGMKYIQDLSCEERPDYGLFMYLVKFWTTIQFLLNFGQRTKFLYMYMRSFVIKTYFGLVQFSVNSFSHILYVCKMRMEPVV